jgi:flavin reductase (DIM6/NTAB) family NADH-FMN oxidoreductase RutF
MSASDAAQHVEKDSNSSPEAALRAFNEFATGVTVVTAAVDGVPCGLSVIAFSAACYEPPTVTIAVTEGSKTLPQLLKSDFLAVNMLSKDQSALAMVFAQSGADKFASTQWHPGAHGSPILDGVSAYLEAEITDRVKAGTATLFIGKVVSAHTSDRAPLVYYHNGFHDGSVLEQAGA